MKIGDIIEYQSGYGNNKKFKYRITHIYKNAFGLDWWYDLKAVEPNILTHFEEHLSIVKYEVKAD